ncbi:MAG: hypothetical protein WD607_09680, partial [Candidatus Paceibacterota bacterium]
CASIRAFFQGLFPSGLNVTVSGSVLRSIVHRAFSVFIFSLTVPEKRIYFCWQCVVGKDLIFAKRGNFCLPCDGFWHSFLFEGQL